MAMSVQESHANLKKLCQDYEAQLDSEIITLFNKLPKDAPSLNTLIGFVESSRTFGPLHDILNKNSSLKDLITKKIIVHKMNEKLTKSQDDAESMKNAMGEIQRDLGLYKNTISKGTDSKFIQFILKILTYLVPFKDFNKSQGQKFLENAEKIQTPKCQ